MTDLESENMALRATIQKMLDCSGHMTPNGFKKHSDYVAFCDVFSDAKEAIDNKKESR